jgi:hypothetical protein
MRATFISLSARTVNGPLFLFVLAAGLGDTAPLRAQVPGHVENGRQDTAASTKRFSDARDEVIITEDGFEETLKTVPGTNIYEVKSRRKLSPDELPGWHPLSQGGTP